MAPTATVKSIKVTNASAAYHRRLYLTPELLHTGRQEREETNRGEGEKHNVSGGEANQIRSKGRSREHKEKRRKTDKGTSGLKKSLEKKEKMNRIIFRLLGKFRVYEQ